MAHCNIIDRYCREVEAAAKPIGSYGASVLQKLRGDLEEFMEEHPNTPESELRKHFGEPEAYILEYTATMEPQEKKQFITDRSFKRKLWVTVVAVTLAVVVALALWIGMRNGRTAADYSIGETIDGPFSPAGGY